MNLYLIPAYGRTYNTGKDVIRAWKTGIDFKIYNGPYVSIRDSEYLIRDGYTYIKLIF